MDEPPPAKKTRTVVCENERRIIVTKKDCGPKNDDTRVVVDETTVPNQDTRVVLIENNADSSQITGGYTDEAACENALRDGDEEPGAQPVSQCEKNASGLQVETDVGITEFISGHLGMTGVIKQRWSDFIVREVDLEGRVVSLTSFDIPEEISEISVMSLTDLLTEEQFTGLHSFSEKEDPKDVYMIEVSEDKETRTQLHRAIKTFYPALVSNTINKADKKYLELRWKPNNSDHRQQRWPKNRGDYCRFVLYKENKDTMECVNLLAKKAKLRSSLFTYAGTKDKRAITTQEVTVHKVPAEKLLGLNKILRGVSLGNFQYVKNALKLGDLKGNQFSVVLRNFTASTEELESAMKSLSSIGFINYFGMQRFGTTSVPTHHIGRALLQSRWSEAIDLILKPRENDYPEMAAARQEWVTSRDPSACLKHLRHKHCIEKSLLEGLQRHNKNDLISALASVARNTRHMYIHSYQSFIWNTMVSQRIRTLGVQPVIGDLVLPADWKNSAQVTEDGKGSIQPTVLTEDNINKYTINDVVMPLPGYDVVYPGNEVASWYQDMLSDDGLKASQLRNKVKDYSLPGDYRHIIVKPEQVSWHQSRYDDPSVPLLLNDHDQLNGKLIKPSTEGKFEALILEFILPPSCYATMALRELLKSDTAPSSQAKNNVA